MLFITYEEILCYFKVLLNKQFLFLKYLIFIFKMVLIKFPIIISNVGFSYAKSLFK